MDIFSIQDDLQTARFKQSKPHIFYFASSFTARVPSLHQAAAWNCAGNFLHNLADKHSLVTHQHERDRGGGIMRPLNATAFSAFFTEEIVCCVVTHLIFWTPFSKHTHHFSCEGTRCARCRAPCCPVAGAGCRWCSDAPVNPEEKKQQKHRRQSRAVISENEVRKAGATHRISKKQYEVEGKLHKRKIALDYTVLLGLLLRGGF